MSKETADLSEMARAREWLDMAQAKWRLQTMQHRSRYNPKTGEYRQLPTRIRRFLNGTPVGIKTSVLRLLKESAPYRSPVFDCEIDQDLEYNPTNTFIRKDGPEHTTGGKDPTYTIIQDLLLADENGDTFGFGDELTCAQAGETEYRWDEPYVGDVNDFYDGNGTQGVSYQITDINRDRDTDLFSYRVRKVQALTIHVPEHVVECDGRKRTTTEVWDNVYGEPGDFRWDPVKGGSAEIATPEPCGQPDGTTVKVDVYRNPDCTYRLTVQTTQSRLVDGQQFSIYRDQYKANSTERDLNAAAPLPREGVEYAGGVTTRYSSEKNEDGTYTNTVEEETERPVAMSSVEHRSTPRGTSVRWTDTNQPAAASGISTQFGSWKSTKTPGGLFTNEYVEYVRSQRPDLGMTCSDNLFAKTHEIQSSVSSVPNPSTTHVPFNADGLVTTWSYDTDPDGFVTRRERTEREHAVQYAVKRRTWGFLGTTSGFQHRSVPASLANDLYDAEAVGTTVEVKRTNGGLYDVDVQTFLRVDGRTLGFDCSKTIYRHEHETTTSAAEVGAEASDAGGGHTYRKSYSVDASTGAVTCREQTATELSVPYAKRSVRVAARGTTVRTTAANAAGRPNDPTAVGSETEWEKTPGGLYNVTKTTVSARTGDIAKSDAKDAFLTSTGTSKTQKSAPTGGVSGGTDGRYAERTARLGDDGLWEVSSTVHEEHRSVDNGDETVVTVRGRRHTTKTRQTSKPAVPAASAVGTSVRSTRTRGGLYDVERTTFDANPRDIGTAEEEDAFLSTDGVTRMSASAPAQSLAGGTNGRYAERTARLGDDGLWEISTSNHAEKGVTGEVHVVVTARSHRKTVIVRQTASQGTEPAASVSDAGKEFRRTKTRGGWWNTETTVTTALAGTNSIDCSDDMFLHSHSTGSSANGATAEHVAPTVRMSGVYRARRQQLGDDGIWSVTDTMHTEHGVPSQRIEERGTRYGVVKRVTNLQGTETGDAVRATPDDVGRERVAEVTRGGRINLTTTTVTALRGSTGSACEKTNFLHTHVSHSVEGSKDAEETDAAADGVYKSLTFSLTDVGTWEKRETVNTELQPSCVSHDYQDAFGTTTVDEEHSVAQEDGTKGGKEFSAETLIRSVETSMTNGARYTVRTKLETPTEVDSGWLHFEKTTDKGLATYHDFIVFRNARLSDVKDWLRHIKEIDYTGSSGSFSNHPSISISPNKFKLWDGTIGIVTNFTPKAWASGGTTTDDKWELDDITIKSVNFVPLSSSKLLKIVTEETHRRGGGVGKDEIRSVLGRGSMIKGSQFSYHPGGQAYTYDIITAVSTKGTVINLPKTPETIWDGSAM